MATVTVNDSNLYDIADSIRAKLGVQTTYKPSQMADAIDSISGGGITPTGTKSITANGTYDVTQYASAEVAVPSGGTPVINPLSVTTNGTYTAPTGVDGYSPVTVNVSGSGGGIVFTATSSCTKANQAAQMLFPDIQSGHLYLAHIINKSISSYEINQLVSIELSESYTGGNGMRFRNGVTSPFQGTTSSYDVVISVGDQYELFDITL